MLGLLDLALADGHLFRDDGCLVTETFSSFTGMTISSSVSSPRAARPAAGSPLDDDLLALDRHVDGLVLGDDPLAHAHLAGLDGVFSTLSRSSRSWMVRSYASRTASRAWPQVMPS